MTLALTLSLALPQPQPFLPGFTPNVLETLRFGGLRLRGRNHSPGDLLQARLHPRLIGFSHAVGHFAPVSLSFHFERDPRNVRPRLSIDALRFEGSMIDPGCDARLLECLVGDRRPAGSHMQKFMDCGFEAELAAVAVVHVQRRFRAKPLASRLAGGREQMCVEIPRIAAGKITRCMDGDIHRKAVSIGQFLRESSDQRQPLRRREFYRQRDQIFASDARILTALGAFRRIPEAGSVSGPRQFLPGESARQHDLLVHDVLAPGMIVGSAGAFVADAFTGTVSTGTRGAAAAGAAEDLHVQKVDGHGGHALRMLPKNAGSTAYPAADASNRAGTCRSSMLAAASSLEGVKAPAGSQCSG